MSLSQKRFTSLLTAVILIVVSTIFNWIQLPITTYAQANRTVNCGDIIETEFSKDYEGHTYALSMEPRESFNVSIEHVGDFLQSRIELSGPTGIKLAQSTDRLGKTPYVESGILSARGTYRIFVINGISDSSQFLKPKRSDLKRYFFSILSNISHTQIYSCFNSFDVRTFSSV